MHLTFSSWIGLKGRSTSMLPSTGPVWAHWHFQPSAICLRGRLQFLKSSDKIFWGSFATCFPSLYEVATVRDREQHWKDLSSHPAWLLLHSSCPEKKISCWVLSWCGLLLPISLRSVWADVTCFLLSKMTAASAVILG